MSKRTVTMKSLIDENLLLKMRVERLEAEIAAHKARGFWPKVVELVRMKRSTYPGLPNNRSETVSCVIPGTLPDLLSGMDPCVRAAKIEVARTMMKWGAM